MTMLNIETSSDLEEFLKVLAEESVKASKKTISEDAEQSEFMAALKNDKMLYSQGLHEQEEDEEDEALDVGEDEEADEEADEDAEEDVEEEPAGGESDSDSSEDESSLMPSYITVRDDINDIRSGTSLKIPDTKQGLETYIGRLSDEEKKVLSTFLKAIGNIMHGRVSGDDAQDPSDDPVSLAVGIEDEQEEEKDIKSGNEEEEGEDTSPPIKVGKEEESLKESFREKVLLLMNA